MDIIMKILSAVLGMGLFFYILNGALKNTRYKVRGMINFILGIVFAGVFVFAFFYDYVGGKLLSYYEYFLFILMSLVYGIGFAYHFLIRMRGRTITKRNLSKYYFTEYLYIIYRHENDICLKNRKEKYHGLVYRLKNNEYHDSFIHKLNQRLKVTGKIEINKLGKVTYKSKRKTYFCYEITVYDSQEIKNLESVNAYQLVNLPLEQFDKEILYRLILREPFDIDK